MAKPIKIWSGTEWIDVAVQAPSAALLTTTAAFSAHTSSTTNVHGIANTALLATTATIDNEELLIIAGAW